MAQLVGNLIFAPICIFQMGKVGSISLLETLAPQSRGIVVHAHAWEWMPPRLRLFLRLRMRLRLPIYVICPIRDPLSRNVSAFFHNFSRDTGQRWESQAWTTDQLLSLFLRRSPQHNIALAWFDDHFRAAFQIDVYARSFPILQKWQTYRKGSVRLLVYRTDLDQPTQAEIIARFLNRPISHWQHSNIAANKPYAATYQTFCTSAQLPDSYLAIMCNSRFFRHFWSEEEISAIAMRWGASDDCQWSDITLLGRQTRWFTL